jgi:hypothetical protein
MKKFTLAIALLLTVSFAFAQRAYLNGIPMDGNGFHFVNDKTVTDTLAPQGFIDASALQLFPSTGGGYVCGNNGYGDKAKAQAFLVDQGYKVEGVLLWVGAKEITSTPGTVTVTLNKMNGTAVLSTGNGDGPGTSLGTAATATKAVDQIDTSSSFGTFGTFMFTAPVLATADYAVVVDLTGLGNDTIGIVSCDDGDAQGSELTFDKWSDNTWHSILEPGNWGLDIDMCIFPVVDLSTQSIDDAQFINGIRMSQNFPNPVVEQTEIRFELQNSADVTCFVSDMNGRMVRVIEAGQLEAGQHNMTLDLSDLSAGSYFYAIQAGSNRLSMRMQVVR